MRYRVFAGSLPATALVVLALATPADAASCRNVTVDRGGYGGEEGAFNIRAKGLACKSARRVVRSYLKTGEVPLHWGLRKNRSTFTLLSGRREITFRVAS